MTGMSGLNLTCLETNNEFKLANRSQDRGLDGNHGILLTRDSGFDFGIRESFS